MADSIKAGRDKLRLRLAGADEQNVSLWVVPFKPRNPPSTVNRWEEDRPFELAPDATGTYYLDLVDMERRLIDRKYPFKAYLSVPLSRRSEYCGNLADAEAIITGRGDEDPTRTGNWRIWFLFPNALLHPDIEDVYRMNMKLDDA